MYLEYFLSVAFLIVYSLGGLCFGENSLPLSESFSEVQELSKELNNKFSEEVFLALLEIAKGESKHSEARVKAIGAIGYLSEAYQQEMSSLALPVLSEALRSDDPYVASSAARAIGAFGQFAESYIDDLIAVIEFNRDSSVGFNGIKSLGLIKAEPKKVVPFLASLVPGRKSNGRAIWGRGDELDALSAYGHEASKLFPIFDLGYKILTVTMRFVLQKRWLISMLEIGIWIDSSVSPIGMVIHACALGFF